MQPGSVWQASTDQAGTAVACTNIRRSGTGPCRLASLTLLRRSGRSCDVRSHVVSEYVEGRLADARDVVQAVSVPVPALACAAGSCPAGCEARGKARGTRSARVHRRGEGWCGVNDSEPLLMPRHRYV